MHSQQFKPIAILGAGSWGTALALHLGRLGQTVNIWSIETSEITSMQEERMNNRYLPGVRLADTIHPTLDLSATIEGVADVLIVVPSVGFRQTLTKIKPLIQPNVGIVCASKGLDADTGELMSQVAATVLGKERRFAALSGPSFAREVAVGLPTAVMIASEDAAFARTLIERFNSPLFRAYPSNDVIGLEVGGVVKNVIAIATGMSDGMEFGANARSALITHGLEEIVRLGTALGGKKDTFFGLSGLGDLVLTCTDNQSRNRRFGLALGKGQNVKEAEREIGQVVEGKRNAESVVQLAQRLGVEMPICTTVWRILQDELKVKEAVGQLLFH